MDEILTLATGLAALAVMTVFWSISLRQRDAGVADVGWGLAFTAVAWAAFVFGERSPAMLLAAVLTSAWGLRLAIHIGRRNFTSGEEDRRYAAMRDRHPEAFWLWSLFAVFLLQGVLALFVAMPLRSLGGVDQDSIGVISWLGVVVFLIGFAVEAIGDAQLEAFKKDPSSKGEVMDRGLWRYTRHPNYFGDATVWWGLWLVAVGSGAAWWTAVGPALMTYLIVQVSGVKMLESDMAERRPGYRDYMRRTSAFVPMPPKHRGTPSLS